jgi:guanylate kinase
MLCEQGMARPAVTTTSRDMREGEVDGVDYYFISKREFEQLIPNMIEHDQFNGWYYGITQDEFDNTNLSILTPRGLKKYKKLIGRNNLFVIYVDTPLKVRYDRIISRGDDPKEAFRRFVHDEIDFEDFRDWDFVIDGSTESYDHLIKLFSNKENLFTRANINI